MTTSVLDFEVLDWFELIFTLFFDPSRLFEISTEIFAEAKEGKAKRTKLKKILDKFKN